MRTFTRDEAFAAVPGLVALADELVAARAELTVAVRSEPAAPLAERKALEAMFADLLDRVADIGVQVKGWAPLLVDFPVVHDGREVLLCWLEGDRELTWYHEIEHGFAGRRPIADLGL